MHGSKGPPTPRSSPQPVSSPNHVLENSFFGDFYELPEMWPHSQRPRNFPWHPVEHLRRLHQQTDRRSRELTREKREEDEDA